MHGVVGGWLSSVEAKEPAKRARAARRAHWLRRMELLSSDGQLIQLSDAAAKQSVTLQGAEDVDDGAPVPVPLLDSGRLQRITALLDRSTFGTRDEG